MQANGIAAGHAKVEMPPVAKPVPAIASVKAEPVPQTAKNDDGKEFLYATKVWPPQFCMPSLHTTAAAAVHMLSAAQTHTSWHYVVQSVHTH